MPLYYFHISGGECLRDESGTELSGLEEARLEAIMLAGALLKDNPQRVLDGQSWALSVEDENGQCLFSLQLNANTPASREKADASTQAA